MNLFLSIYQATNDKTKHSSILIIVIDVFSHVYESLHHWHRTVLFSVCLRGDPCGEFLAESSCSLFT